MKNKKQKNKFFINNFLKKNSKATILIENVIFIILNVVFISILILFLWRQGSGVVLLEQTHAKQISLLIDSAKPGMEIKLKMDDAKEVADENEIDFSEVISITGNVVRIKLSEKGGYGYSFFNDVQVDAFPQTDNQNEYTGVYIFKIN